MPTLFTSLRAQHQTGTPRPIQTLPPTKSVRATRATADISLLESERQFSVAAQPSTLRKRPRSKPKRKIAVIGAGLAGLCAAYELQGLGYEIVVYEARDRVGGRVESLSSFSAGKIAEGGGELIGSNHPLWNSYRQHFGLHFSDVKEYRNSPYRFGGKTLSFEVSQALVGELTDQLKLLTDLAETVVDAFEPWSNRNARRLDSMVLTDWVSKARCSDLCKGAINGMLAADNGIPANEQSLLGVLAMIKGGGLDRYWTDSELYRCEGGNQQLAEKFREKLNRRRDSVLLQCPVTSIRKANRGVSLHTNEGRSLGEYDDVILAVPPSVWNQIRVVGFPELAAKLSDPPAMGRNVKCLLKIKSRFWEVFGSSPTLSEDGPVDLTWETTEQDRKADFVMVAFSGADDADKCSSWHSKSRRKKYVEALQAPYPGVDRQILDLEFKDWPREKWTKASYYFPRRGEVTLWGPFWKSGYDNWLHFAGEHTCYAFVGYMEGALSSGYRLARTLAVRDRVFLA
jgi:monoamine oxidase